MDERERKVIMPWIIDFDVNGDRSKRAPCNANATGMMGPGGYEGDGSELTKRFRMSCDDGNVCPACGHAGREVVYYGRAHEDYFGPLDNFGEPNYGCNTIEYWDENLSEWRVL